MAQSLRNSLKRQSLCWGSQSWVDSALPWLALAGEEDAPGLLLELPAFVAVRRVKGDSAETMIY